MKKITFALAACAALTFAACGNNATEETTTTDATATETTTEEWDMMINCNLKSMYLLTRELTPHMKENKYGVIINLSSIFHKGEKGQCLYSNF